MQENGMMLPNQAELNARAWLRAKIAAGTELRADFWEIAQLLMEYTKYQDERYKLLFEAYMELTRTVMTPPTMEIKGVR
jgi:hypothetical protein